MIAHVCIDPTMPRIGLGRNLIQPRNRCAKGIKLGTFDFVVSAAIMQIDDAEFSTPLGAIWALIDRYANSSSSRVLPTVP